MLTNACFQTQRRGRGSTMGPQTFFLKKNDILHFHYITKCNYLAVCVELLVMRINIKACFQTHRRGSGSTMGPPFVVFVFGGFFLFVFFLFFLFIVFFFLFMLLVFFLIFFFHND